MRTRVAAALAVLVLGIAAPASSAMAFQGRVPDGRTVPAGTYTGTLVGDGVHDGPNYVGCPMSSAAEGNANQQTRPVKQYGQTSGGNRC